MKRILTPILALALASCQVAAPTKVASKGATPSPKPSAATSPAATAEAAKASPLPAPAKLARPGGTSVLAGRVAMDAAYVVGRTAGQLIGNDGASVLAANSHLISNDGGGIITNDGGSIITNDGGSIITNDGGSLISNDGGGIVAQGAGNVIAPAALISNDGGGLITNDGGGLITNDGGGLISNDGGGLITNDGGSRRLLADAAAPDHHPRPAAGMAIYVRDLTTHKAVALGQDKDGKPVYAIYSNLQGDYELYLPDSAKDNVEVVAFVPGQEDARLHLQQITPPGVASAPVDEDTSQIVKYVRLGFRSFAEAMMTGDTVKVAAAMKLDQTPLGTEVYTPVLAGLMADVKAGKVDQIPAMLDGQENPRYRTAADRITDIVLAKAELAAALPNVGYVTAGNPFKPRHEDALHVLADFFADDREHIAPLFDDPAAIARLEALPMVQKFNEGRATPFHFLRPSDFGDFLGLSLINAQTVDATGLATQIADAEQQAGITGTPGEGEWMAAAYTGILNLLAFTLFQREDVKQELHRFLVGGAS